MPLPVVLVVPVSPAYHLPFWTASDWHQKGPEVEGGGRGKERGVERNYVAAVVAGCRSSISRRSSLNCLLPASVVC